MSDPALDLQTIAPAAPIYPAALKTCVAFRGMPTLTAIGNLNLLSQNAIALFCSSQCPSDLIGKIYTLAERLRDANRLVIGGFHSAIEQDCLKILLRGRQPIIHCPARSLHKMRLSAEQHQAVDENRLLLISPFRASQHRMTAELAEKRNELVGAIASTIFIAYAAPNGKTQALAQRLVQAQKSVFIGNSPDNSLGQKPGMTGLARDEWAQLPVIMQTDA